MIDNTPPKDSAEALSLCLRILSKRYESDERITMMERFASPKLKGNWPDQWILKDIAILFYPNDKALEDKMLKTMIQAIEAKELVLRDGNKLEWEKQYDGSLWPTHEKEITKKKVVREDLIAWEGCPPVPNDPPLRFWLPEWMQKAKRSTRESIDALDIENRGEADWKEQARIVADECFDRDTVNSCRDSLKGYSKRVMEEMQKRGIKGPRGIITNSGTIMRDALQGKKWWANKVK